MHSRLGAVFVRIALQLFIALGSLLAVRSWGDTKWIAIQMFASLWTLLAVRPGRYCVYCFLIVDCTMKFAGCEILRWYCVNCFAIVHGTVKSAGCKIWIRFCVNCFTNAHCTLRFAGCEAWRCCANCLATVHCDSINHVVAKHLEFHEPEEYFALWSQQAYESHANGCEAPGVTAGTVSVQWTAVDNHATSFVGKCCTFSMHCSGCCPCCLDMFECAACGVAWLFCLFFAA